MTSSKFNLSEHVADFRTSGLARPAAEKFAGAWLACFLVMTRGSIFAAFSFEHVRLATLCGVVCAAVTVALLAQMDRTTDSVARQATISAIVTFIGDYIRASLAFPAAMGGAGGHSCALGVHCGRAVARQADGQKLLAAEDRRPALSAWRLRRGDKRLRAPLAKQPVANK